ncbi:MAG: DUF3568 family protein [Elusimicrobiota bacterium]|jgi:hypothetical protein
MRHPAILAGLLSLLVLCNGCFLLLGAGAGVGGYSYVQGELSRTYPAGLDAVWAATQQTLAGLTLKVSAQQKDGLGGTIEAARADGTQIRLKLEPGAAGVTTVRIRIGTFGDKKSSADILDRVARNLGTR